MSAILASQKELTPFYMGASVLNQVDACGNSATSLRWHNGSSALPIVGDVVWVTEGKSTLVNPVANSWLPMSTLSTGATFNTVQFDFTQSGLVAAVEDCAIVDATTMTSLGKTTSLLACDEILTTTRYISGGDGIPSDGEIVYTDSNGTTIFDGLGRWYRVGNFVFTVSSLGVVNSNTFCAGP